MGREEKRREKKRKEDKKREREREEIVMEDRDSKILSLQSSRFFVDNLS